MTNDILRRQLLLASGLGAVLGQCGTANASVKNPTLKVAAYPLVDEIIAAALPQWHQLHPDVPVEIIRRQYLDHHTAMTTALSTSSHLPDVMTLEASFVGRYSQGVGLQDLSKVPYNLGLYKDRFVSYAFEQAVNQRQEMIAVPTDIGPGTMLYRQDICSRAGIEASDLTTSWTSYVEAGIKIKARTGCYLIGNAKSVKDIVLRSGVKPGEGIYFGSRSEVLVKSPRFVRAFELAQKIRQHHLDARVNAWTNEWAEGFKRGQLVTELTGAWMVGQLANWVAPNTKGLWRAAQLPEHAYAGYGGSYYAIPRKSSPAMKFLAWEFIQMMTMNAELQFKAFKSQDSFPALIATHSSPFFDEPIPFLGGQKARVIWREAAKNIVSAKVHKQNNFADEAVNMALDHVLNGQAGIEEALSEAHSLLEKRAFR
jgi:multiple sugar transport system substrate-binding protein